MISYQTATINELHLISKFEEQCFDEYERFSIRNLRRMLQNPNHTIILDIILYSDQYVGYAAYFTRHNSSIIRLYSICISPEYSGKGIAKSYLISRVNSFKNKYSKISLEVRENNEKALKLYNSIDFNLREVLPLYYANGVNGLRLEKQL